MKPRLFPSYKVNALATKLVFIELNVKYDQRIQIRKVVLITLYHISYVWQDKFF